MMNEGQKKASVDGACCCFAVLNQAPIKKLINNTYRILTHLPWGYYSVAFCFFFSMLLYKLFSSVVLVIGRFSGCREAFESAVTNAIC